LISNDFENSRQEATLEYLAKYFDNASSGITTEQYLNMCQVMGDEPDINKLPPAFESFPSYVQIALEIFNALPDTYSGGMSPVYTGKNLAALNILFELYLVKDESMKVFDVIRFLDNRARKQAIKEAEKANKKASR
jgi:hypothetical protein